MKTCKLSFGTINILKDNLAEVIINEGVVMDEVIVDAYHDFLLSNLKAPFALLINKKNSYTYTFGAQKTIANLKEIHLMGVAVGTNGGLMSTETLIQLNKGNDWNIRLFNKREEALDWIQSHEGYALNS